ncbi:hypothetical protein MNBD_PLANCTO02-770 [hydrothermal vent metagenome]|uniref:Uncharacterized protein n=1 Tax=hydrothermal vent metagenome TaxID=652676 RepID=A0A3B1DUE3_9ZZZZ
MKNITWLLLCCLFLFSPMLKQEAWSEKTVQQKETQQKGKKQTEPTAAEIKKEKREARTIGTLLLGLIIFLGVVTIFFVIFWGKRMRREIRQERASPTQRDEFWYLQPNENNQEIDKEPTSNKPPEE